MRFASTNTPPGAAHTDEAICRRLEEERRRLRLAAGLAEIRHFRRPQERPFVAAERERVTILIGGLTWKHEALFRAAFQGNGYRCETLANPDAGSFELGKQYGNHGQCNPVHFTVGSLIQFLRGLERQGLSRQEIIDNYVLFTAGSCGPCRFGMYEAEYRYALENAGFGGFRVLLFQQTKGIWAATGEPGLKFTVNFGMGMLNALMLGDVMQDVIYQIRPFEVRPGEANKVFEQAMNRLCATLRDRTPFEFMRDGPGWLTRLAANRPAMRNTLSVTCNILDHLHGKQFLEALEECRETLNSIEVDRTRVKPVVKITGEFWAQTTESDGNFRMFEFLEQEGAQVIVEPISTWVAYMVHLARLDIDTRKRLGVKTPRGKALMLGLTEALWTHLYSRLAARLGGLPHRLAPQEELARLAHPFYHQLTRGGEGYMEVGKNVYYSVNRLCHMVLALKPFGCMPSTQSDGVQSAVTSRFPEMIFLPIETSGEGEVNAHSRVQMALGEAKNRARAEFEGVLKATGKRLEDIEEYVSRHPELRRPFYPVPHRRGVAGTAAQFVVHVNDLINRERRFRWAVRRAAPYRQPV
jgi:predicted nucleotide-binding protein (sugar kinase/HSP70/actin superfamily)